MYNTIILHYIFYTSDEYYVEKLDNFLNYSVIFELYKKHLGTIHRWILHISNYTINKKLFLALINIIN